MINGRCFYNQLRQYATVVLESDYQQDPIISLIHFIQYKEKCVKETTDQTWRSID